MPRYHFEIVNGNTLPDPAGVDCLDDEAASEHGKTVADQIAEDVPGDKMKRHVTVLDDNGRKVASVLIGEVPAQPKP